VCAPVCACVWACEDMVDEHMPASELLSTSFQRLRHAAVCAQCDKSRPKGQLHLARNMGGPPLHEACGSVTRV